MNLFYQPRIPEGFLVLDQEESRHCVKVLRKKTGDEIRITDGQGVFYECVVDTPDAQACTFSIVNRFEEPKKTYSIHIAISPTKSPDRIEWFVEKAVELGIDRISLFESHNSERFKLKTERLIKIAVSAMKQSLKAWLPEIEPLKQFSKVIAGSNESEKFIASVDAANPAHLKDVAGKSQEYIVLIGPEGDFTKEEISHAIAAGFKKVSLGTSRLRTETAGLAACHILNLLNS